MRKTTEHLSLKDIDEWTMKALSAIVGRIQAIEKEITTLQDERRNLEVRRKIYEAAATGLKPKRKRRKAAKHAVAKRVRRATVIDFVSRKRREVATSEVAKHFRLTNNAAYQRLWHAAKQGLLKKEGRAWVAA